MPPRRRPSEGRRVIFPSLHRAATSREVPLQTKPAANKSPGISTQLIRTQTPPPLDDEILIQLGYSPATLSTSHISPRGPIERSKIERSDSLHNLLNNALPKLSLTNEKQRNIQTSAPVGNRNIFTLSRLQSKRLTAPQSAEPRFIFPEQKMFSALITPSIHEGPGKKLLSESKRKPLKSILRSKGGGRSSQSNVSSASSSYTDEDVILSTPQESHHKMHLSADMPTLASPTSIRNLSTPSMKSHDSNDILSESEVLERISEIPKLLPKSSTTLKRNQSDDVVGRNEVGERQRLRKLSEGSDNDSDRHQMTNDRNSSSGEDYVSRHASFEDVTRHKTIGFDPRVLIHEYIPQLTVDELWFTEDELTDFKQEAIKRVRERYSTTVLPTGTGRVVVPSTRSSISNDVQQIGRPETVRFTHPALGCDDDCGTDDAKERLIQGAITQEIRNILLVDVHEIFLALFIKSFKSLFPHISVTTARSGEEAIARVDAAQKAHPVRDGGSLHGFDIILVEERLVSLSAQRSGSWLQTAGDDSTQRRRITSGSELLRSIVQEERNIIRSGESGRHALLIGVSARLAEDGDRLQRSGADVLWAKPPPAMDRNQRNHLLKVLMKKRGKETSMIE